MTRRAIVAANWKMNGDLTLVNTMIAGLANVDLQENVDVVICPSAIYLSNMVNQLKESNLSAAFNVGSQNVSEHDSGAYTGEVSPPMLKDVGCEWVIIGHSERRQYHEESDELIAAKVKAAVAASLNPIVCVGETQQQREDGEAQFVVAKQ